MTVGGSLHSHRDWRRHPLSWSRAHPDRTVLAATAASTLARLVYVSYLGDDLGGPDSNTYDAGGFDIATRGLLSDEIEGLPYFSPGYFLIVGLHYGAFGRHPYAVKLTQVGVVALVSWLTYRVAKRLLDPDEALLVGVGMSLSLVWLAIPHPLMYEPWLALVTVAIVLLVLRSEGGSLRPMVGAGLLLGAAVVLQDKYVTLVVPLGLVVAARGRRQAAVLVASACLVVAPMVARNVVAYGEPLVLASNHGVNLLIGNGEEADGGNVAITLPPRQCPYAKPDLSSHGAVDRRLTLCALREVVDHPGRILTLLPSKFLRFWAPFIGPDEMRNNWRHKFDLRDVLSGSVTASRIFRAVDRILTSLWVIGGLILLGIGAQILFRRIGRWRTLVVLLPLVWLNVVHIVTFGDPRYRLPVLPLVWLMQALGAVAVIRRAPGYHRWARSCSRRGFS